MSDEKAVLLESSKCGIKSCHVPATETVRLCSRCLAVWTGEGDKDSRRKVLSGVLTGDADMDAILLRCLDVLVVKGADYTVGTGDRLHNFRTVGEFTGMTPARGWAAFFYKHVSAVMSFVKSEGKSESEPVEERLVDVVNYCLLFAKLVAEFKRGQKQLLVSKSSERATAGGEG